METVLSEYPTRKEQSQVHLNGNGDDDGDSFENNDFSYHIQEQRPPTCHSPYVALFLSLLYLVVCFLVLPQPDTDCGNGASMDEECAIPYWKSLYALDFLIFTISVLLTLHLWLVGRNESACLSFASLAFGFLVRGFVSKHFVDQGYQNNTRHASEFYIATIVQYFLWTVSAAFFGVLIEMAWERISSKPFGCGVFEFRLALFFIGFSNVIILIGAILTIIDSTSEMIFTIGRISWYISVIVLFCEGATVWGALASEQPVRIWGIQNSHAGKLLTIFLIITGLAWIVELAWDNSVGSSYFAMLAYFGVLMMVFWTHNVLLSTIIPLDMFSDDVSLISDTEQARDVARNITKPMPSDGRETKKNSLENSENIPDTESSSFESGVNDNSFDSSFKDETNFIKPFDLFTFFSMFRAKTSTLKNATVRKSQNKGTHNEEDPVSTFLSWKNKEVKLVSQSDLQMCASPLENFELPKSSKQKGNLNQLFFEKPSASSISSAPSVAPPYIPVCDFFGWTLPNQSSFRSSRSLSIAAADDSKEGPKLLVPLGNDGIKRTLHNAKASKVESNHFFNWINAFATPNGSTELSDEIPRKALVTEHAEKTVRSQVEPTDKNEDKMDEVVTTPLNNVISAPELVGEEVYEAFARDWRDDQSLKTPKSPDEKVVHRQVSDEIEYSKETEAKNSTASKPVRAIDSSAIRDNSDCESSNSLPSTKDNVRTISRDLSTKIGNKTDEGAKTWMDFVTSTVGLIGAGIYGTFAPDLRDDQSVKKPKSPDTIDAPDAIDIHRQISQDIEFKKESGVVEGSALLEERAFDSSEIRNDSDCESTDSSPSTKDSDQNISRDLSLQSSQESRGDSADIENSKDVTIGPEQDVTSGSLVAGKYKHMLKNTHDMSRTRSAVLAAVPGALTRRVQSATSFFNLNKSFGDLSSPTQSSQAIQSKSHNHHISHSGSCDNVVMERSENSAMSKLKRPPLWPGRGKVLSKNMKEETRSDSSAMDDLPGLQSSTIDKEVATFLDELSVHMFSTETEDEDEYVSLARLIGSRRTPLRSRSSTDQSQTSVSARDSSSLTKKSQRANSFMNLKQNSYQHSSVHSSFPNASESTISDDEDSIRGFGNPFGFDREVDLDFVQSENGDDNESSFSGNSSNTGTSSADSKVFLNQVVAPLASSSSQSFQENGMTLTRSETEASDFSEGGSDDELSAFERGDETKQIRIKEYTMIDHNANSTKSTSRERIDSHTVSIQPSFSTSELVRGDYHCHSADEPIEEKYIDGMHSSTSEDDSVVYVASDNSMASQIVEATSSERERYNSRRSRTLGQNDLVVQVVSDFTMTSDDDSVFPYPSDDDYIHSNSKVARMHSSLPEDLIHDVESRTNKVKTEHSQNPEPATVKPIILVHLPSGKEKYRDGMQASHLERASAYLSACSMPIDKAGSSEARVPPDTTETSIEVTALSKEDKVKSNQNNPDVPVEPPLTASVATNVASSKRWLRRRRSSSRSRRSNSALASLLSTIEESHDEHREIETTKTEAEF